MCVKDARILLHQGALPTSFGVDTIRVLVEVAFGRNNHDLRHRPNDRDIILSATRPGVNTTPKGTDRSSDAPTESDDAVHRAPLVGSLRNAKSRDDSHICLKVGKQNSFRAFPHRRRIVKQLIWTADSGITRFA